MMNIKIYCTCINTFLYLSRFGLNLLVRYWKVKLRKLLGKSVASCIADFRMLFQS